MPGMGYLFGENLSAWSHRSTPTWKSTAIPLDYTPESEDKTLLLKTPHICTIEHRDNKFAPDLEASFLLPIFIKLEGTAHVINSFTQLGTLKATNSNRPGKICTLLQ